MPKRCKLLLVNRQGNLEIMKEAVVEEVGLSAGFIDESHSVRVSHIGMVAVDKKIRDILWCDTLTGPTVFAHPANLK